MARSRQLVEALLSEPAPDSSDQQPHPTESDGPLLAVLVARQAAGAVAERHGVRRVPAVLGRSAECDLVLDWPSLGPRHGELTLEAGVWNVAALSEDCPVMVDGEAVASRLPLAPGSSLRLGELELAFLPCDRLESLHPRSQPIVAPEPVHDRRPPPPRFFDEADTTVGDQRWQWVVVGAAVLIALLLLALGVGR